MFQSFKETWDKIQDDPPGERFYRQYHRRQEARETVLNRVLFIGVALVFLIIGIIFIFTPGPGLLFIFVGLGLIAQESLWLSKALDKLEVYLRRWVDWGKEQWNDSSRVVQVLIITVIVMISAGALYVAYRIFFVP